MSTRRQPRCSGCPTCIDSIQEAIFSGWPSHGEENMASLSSMPGNKDERLQQKASEIIRDFGPAIHGLLQDMNTTRLNGQGRLGSAEIGRKAIRWELEWKADPVSYRVHIGVTIADDGKKAFVDRVLVQREASAPYSFRGHTPTTMMKQIAQLDMHEIKAKLVEVWPQ